MLQLFCNFFQFSIQNISFNWMAFQSTKMWYEFRWKPEMWIVVDIESDDQFPIMVSLVTFNSFLVRCVVSHEFFAQQIHMCIANKFCDSIVAKFNAGRFMLFLHCAISHEVLDDLKLHFFFVISFSIHDNSSDNVEFTLKKNYAFRYF